VYVGLQQIGVSKNMKKMMCLILIVTIFLSFALTSCAPSLAMQGYPSSGYYKLDIFVADASLWDCSSSGSTGEHIHVVCRSKISTDFFEKMVHSFSFSLASQP
jgi:hypothetical protein